jgi:ribosome-associated protein
MPSTPKKPERRPRRKSPPKNKFPSEIKIAVAAALDKKAVDLVVLDLRKGTAFTDAFVICTGNNVKQVQAIADGVEAALKKAGERPALVEGYQKADWILLDYFDFIVHVFTPQTRLFYDLERLWGDAEKMEVDA